MRSIKKSIKNGSCSCCNNVHVFWYILKLTYAFSVSVTSMSNFIILVPLLVLSSQSQACYIWGTDSGQCTSESLDAAWRATNMPNCADAITFPVCIPQYQVGEFSDFSTCEDIEIRLNKLLQWHSLPLSVRSVPWELCTSPSVNYESQIKHFFCVFDAITVSFRTII